ncbi:MAG TPA: helix-hairpin-helix domain-containing protein [Candidatus Dormibacteraeota bacterium]|jgi:ERCC4-type nuclease|nr:helix-hairpin-helix domain-containing protein [Candidatus Dormibacteraeota bacterium]
MPLPPIELDLPLGDTEETELGTRRHRHLTELPGVDDAVAVRLERAFPTLAALYSATEDRLAEVVGPVTAARIRWFLDAPLRPPVPVRRGSSGWRHAA